MNSFPRLLCLAVLATTAAVAQNSSLPYDPSLAADSQPAASQPKNAQTPAAKPSATHPGAVPSQAAKPSAAQLEATAVALAESASQHKAQANPQPYSQPSAQPSAQPYSQPKLQPASQPYSQPTLQPRLQTRSLPAGTVLPVATVLRLKLDLPISTASAQQGQRFFATLTQPVKFDGSTVIPAGTSVACRVDGAHAARRFARKPSLDIKALSAHLPNGAVLHFTASVIDTAAPHRYDVDEEGRIHGVAFSPMDKVEMGSLAGAGLVAGTVIAGPEGLLIGTAGGAALAAGHIVVKHRDLTLPAGTELIFELDAPATLTQPPMEGSL